MKKGDTVYYFDGNYRIYRDKLSAPIYSKHFRPLKIIGENEKEFLLDFGTINKKSGMWKQYNERRKIYTEQEKNDNIYIEENARKTADEVRMIKDASLLKEIKKIIEQNLKK